MNDKGFDKQNQEVEINGEVYRIRFERVDGCVYVYATPCSLPSAVFQIAQVCELENRCSEFVYYEATIYSDPVEIIIDCNLCNIIKRALEIYFENASFCNGNRGCSCNRFLGLF